MTTRLNSRLLYIGRVPHDINSHQCIYDIMNDKTTITISNCFYRTLAQTRRYRVILTLESHRSPQKIFLNSEPFICPKVIENPDDGTDFLEEPGEKINECFEESPEFVY
jgi:hypothetical protein